VSILIDVAARGDVVQERAHAVFTISKISFCTKPTVISSFSTSAAFQLKPTVSRSLMQAPALYVGRNYFSGTELKKYRGKDFLPTPTCHFLGGEGRKTQPRTPKMIRQGIILQRFCPPISMGRAAVPPTDGAADPYGPEQGPRGWVWWRDGWFACLGRQKETHQKNREPWCIGLRWPPFSGNI
jgi:hypothetical protein